MLINFQKYIILNMRKYFFYLILFFLFPVNVCFLEELLPNESDNEEVNDNNNNLKYYIGGFIIVGLILTIFYSQGFEFPFFKKDPYDTTIEYKYPNDGQCRPPQNPTFIPMYDYFCIPNKPYFVDGYRNYALLNKDMMTYIFTAQFCPSTQDIPWYFIRGFEILWGYDIHQLVFMNLQYHRCTFPLEVDMETVLGWNNWYYQKFPCRKTFEPWSAREGVWMHNKVPIFDTLGLDWFDCRIFPDIYTKARSLPHFFP